MNPLQTRLFHRLGECLEGSSHFPLPMEEICETIGIKLWPFQSKRRSLSWRPPQGPPFGLLDFSFWDGEQPFIRHDSCLTSTWKRAVLAHEIFHLLTMAPDRPGFEESGLRHTQGDEDQDAFASLFAMELLSPLPIAMQLLTLRGYGHRPCSYLQGFGTPLLLTMARVESINIYFQGGIFGLVVFNKGNLTAARWYLPRSFEKLAADMAHDRLLNIVSEGGLGNTYPLLIESDVPHEKKENRRKDISSGYRCVKLVATASRRLKGYCMTGRLGVDFTDVLTDETPKNTADSERLLFFKPLFDRARFHISVEPVCESEPLWNRSRKLVVLIFWNPPETQGTLYMNRSKAFSTKMTNARVAGIDEEFSLDVDLWVRELCELVNYFVNEVPVFSPLNIAGFGKSNAFGDLTYFYTDSRFTWHPLYHPMKTPLFKTT